MSDAEAGPIRRKVCAACGQPFECRAGGCWCDEVTLTADVRARLRERYVDCLCPGCLARFAPATPMPA